MSSCFCSLSRRKEHNLHLKCIQRREETYSQICIPFGSDITCSYFGYFQPKSYGNLVLDFIGAAMNHIM